MTETLTRLDLKQPVDYRSIKVSSLRRFFLSLNQNNNGDPSVHRTVIPLVLHTPLVWLYWSLDFLSLHVVISWKFSGVSHSKLMTSRSFQCHLVELMDASFLPFGTNCRDRKEDVFVPSLSSQSFHGLILTNVHNETVFSKKISKVYSSDRVIKP